MGGNLEWETNEVYSQEQVESILSGLHVDPSWETETNFLCLCPFHDNHDTPAFSVAKESGLYMCFTPHCGVRGNLNQLVMRLGDMNKFQARRFIQKYAGEVDISAIVKRNLEPEPDFPTFDQGLLDKMKEDFPSSPAYEYMKGRGFTDDSLDYFDIGYSVKQRMVVVPMHDPNGNPIGIIGRSIEGKRFKNSLHLPKTKTAWNFHRAKRAGDAVILCESSFDAIRIRQCGFDNVVALLGGYVSSYHVRQLGRSFSTLIIMTDADEAGRNLANSIRDKMSDKRILWGAWSEDELYPHGAKDASDMTDEEIQHLIRNAVGTVTYNEWYT